MEKKCRTDEEVKRIIEAVGSQKEPVMPKPVEDKPVEAASAQVEGENIQQQTVPQ